MRIRNTKRRSLTCEAFRAAQQVHGYDSRQQAFESLISTLKNSFPVSSQLSKQASGSLFPVDARIKLPYGFARIDLFPSTL